MSKSKSPPQPQSLQSIDPKALANVSGGASRTPSSSSSSSSSGGGDATLTALNGILDSLKSLSNNQNRGFGTNEMLLLMMMMNRGSQPTVVTAPAPASPWGPYGPWPY